MRFDDQRAMTACPGRPNVDSIGVIEGVIVMNIVKRAFIATSLLCGAAYVIKIALIAAADGGDSAFIGAMWVVGTLTFLAASAFGVAYLLRAGAVWMRIVAGVAAVPLAFVAMGVIDNLVKSVYRADGWFRDELSLLIMGVVIAALGLRVLAGGNTAGSTSSQKVGRATDPE